ncbi:MAG: transketolase C-terminal domain-containing protein [bacterium]
MKKVLTGNQAVSWAVRLAKPQVIAAYPITPQSPIVEELSEMCAEGVLDSDFMACESEHSAMSACIGASAAGVRTFTATSSQGLAYMHEMLHWAAGGRLPVVMAEVNRSLAPPWTIYTDQQDSLSQRDTGWLQFYCRNNQEVLDSILIAFKVAERVSLPAMVVLDAFILSHTAETVDIPDEEIVQSFLPPRDPAYRLRPDDPRAIGGMKRTDCWMETRYDLQTVMEYTTAIVEEEALLWGSLTGRVYPLIHTYRWDKAEIGIFSAGSTSYEAQLAADALREEGIPCGTLSLWLFRPFPVETLRKLCQNLHSLIIIDRSCSYGHSGIFAQEVRSALYELPKKPKILGVIGGLGGREITSSKIAEWVKSRVPFESGLPRMCYWMDLRSLGTNPSATESLITSKTK